MTGWWLSFNPSEKKCATSNWVGNLPQVTSPWLINGGDPNYLHPLGWYPSIGLKVWWANDFPFPFVKNYLVNHALQVRTIFPQSFPEKASHKKSPPEFLKMEITRFTQWLVSENGGFSPQIMPFYCNRVFHVNHPFLGYLYHQFRKHPKGEFSDCFKIPKL